MRVTREQVQERGPHQFMTDASDIGLRAGHWPKTLETDLGNKLPFMFSHHLEHEGDLLWVTYQQANGCITLKVFND